MLFWEIRTPCILNINILLDAEDCSNLIFNFSYRSIEGLLFLYAFLKVAQLMM